VSISSNFGEKRMAKTAKLQANSLKLFLAYSKTFIEFCMKMFCEMAFLSFARKSRASCKKDPYKLLMKLLPGRQVLRSFFFIFSGFGIYFIRDPANTPKPLPTDFFRYNKSVARYFILLQTV
jgi:hypothetical protein